MHRGIQLAQALPLELRDFVVQLCEGCGQCGAHHLATPATRPTGPTHPTRHVRHVTSEASDIHHGPSPAGPQRRWTSEDVQKHKDKDFLWILNAITLTVPRQTLKTQKRWGKNIQNDKEPDGN